MPTIGDLVPKVRFELGNRTDIDDKITSWLIDAYRELCMGYDLETLETSVQNLTVSGIDTYAYPDDARAMKSLFVVQSNQPIEVKKKNIQVVRRYQVNGMGVPVIWAPFGSQYLVRPVPNGEWTLLVDYWRVPTIDETDTASMNTTEVELPDDWFEILVFSAAERGHAKLQEADKAQAVHMTLHGDPNPQKGWPGILKERTNRNAAENAISDYGLRPRIRRYTS